MSWNAETPLELQNRLRAQNERRQQEQEIRAAAERERLERPAPAPAKDLSELHDPVERQNFIAQRRAEQKAKEAERAAGLMKDRAMRAYLEAGGTESGFEESWPALQKRMIEDEAIKRMQG